MKKICVFIGGIVIGYLANRFVQTDVNKAYTSGVNDYWMNETNKLHKHVEELHKTIDERDEMLKKSTEQTEELLNMMENK